MNVNVAGTAPSDIAYRAPRSPVFAYFALIALVLALQFSSMVGLLGFRATGSPAWTFIGIARDALVLLLSAIVLLQSALSNRGRKWKASTKWTLVTLIGLAAAAYASTAEPTIVALNLRRLLLFPLLCLAVTSSRLTPNQILALLNLVVLTTVFIAVFGILEYLAPNSLWSVHLGVIDYFSSNPLDPFGSLQFEQSGRFFSWDLASWTGGPVRRAVSTYLEPTTFAAALVCGVCLLAAAYNRRERGARWKICVVVVCGILTLSKAFGLAMIMLVLYLNTGFPSPRRLFILTAIGGTAALLLHRADMLAVGMLSHIAGLATSIDHVISGNIFGDGLGNAGNYAAEGSDMEIGAESGLGNLLAQLGIVALLYILWIQSLVTDLLNKARTHRDRTGKYIGAMLMCWYVSFLFSASSLGIGGNALTFLAVSLYLHRNYPTRS